jgi:hypothetical protein
MKDGNLRLLFRNQFKSWQWTSIETSGSASGVPDSEFCTPEGIQGWVEFKTTKIFHVQIKPFQVSWLDKRCRYGGNAWIAVRRLPTAQTHTGADELWLIFGNQAIALAKHGLKNVMGVKWGGGPSNWNWDEVASILQSCGK